MKCIATKIIEGVLNGMHEEKRPRVIQEWKVDKIMTKVNSKWVAWMFYTENGVGQLVNGGLMKCIPPRTAEIWLIGGRKWFIARNMTELNSRTVVCWYWWLMDTLRWFLWRTLQISDFTLHIYVMCFIFRCFLLLVYVLACFGCCQVHIVGDIQLRISL